MILPIDTPRLRLRLLQAGDADFVCELVNDPAWLRFIGDRNIHSRADAEAYIEKCHAMHRRHGVCLLAVARRDDDCVLGICGLLRRDHWNEVDLGFAFLERFRGAGFAREAADAMLVRGHGELGYPRIVALTHPENAASIALLEKLGFQLESRITQPGVTGDTLLFVSHAKLSTRDAAAG